MRWIILLVAASTLIFGGSCRPRDALGSDVAATPSESCAPLRFPVLYFDMDGTLLDRSSKIPADTLKALGEFVACGGRFGIATGRIASQVDRHVARLKPQLPLVLYNGAVTMDPKGQEVLASDILPRESVDKLTRRLGTMPEAQGTTVYYSDEVISGRMSESAQRMYSHTDVEFSERCGNELEACMRRRMDQGKLPVKVLIVVDKGDGDRLSEKLNRWMAPEARAVVSSPRTVEVLLKTSNKGKAIRQVLASEGIPMGDVLVFGDSLNDKEMLEQFPVSVVMDNCHKDVCGSALFRTGDNGSGAIPRIIRNVAMRPNP